MQVVATASCAVEQSAWIQVTKGNAIAPFEERYENSKISIAAFTTLELVD